MQLVVDTREQMLIPLLPNCSVRQLDLGDIIIENDSGILLFIERKSETDLIASIKDGRYSEQKSRLMLVDGIYIIECSNNISGSVLGAIVNMTIRDKIRVIRTTNIYETSEVIINIYKKFSEGKLCYDTKNTISKRKIVSPKECLEEQLCCIPMISIKTAQLLSAKFNDMKDFITKFNNSKINGIGKKKREKIIEMLGLSENM